MTFIDVPPRALTVVFLASLAAALAAGFVLGRVSTRGYDTAMRATVAEIGAIVGEHFTPASPASPDAAGAAPDGQ